MLELRLCGGVDVEVDGRLLPESLVGGRQGRIVLAYLACERDRAVRRDELADLLWPDALPESWAASLSAVISRLRRLFTEAGLDGSAVVVSTPGAYQLVLPAAWRVDVEEVVASVGEAEQAARSGDTERALEASLRVERVAARGFLADDCEWVDARREALRELRVRAAIAESVAHVGASAPVRAVEAARRAVELDATKEAAYRQLMHALSAAGERAEALRVWERCRITLLDELGSDPSPETEDLYLALLETKPHVPNAAAEVTAQLPSGVVTFLLTDIVESSALWEDHATAMAAALERHDAIVDAVVAAHGGALLKSKLEGDATVSVFSRATECAAAALALQDAIDSEPWIGGVFPRVRMALHTGEAFERGGDYFGPALNRAARMRSLAAASEVLLSQAVAELVRDHLPAGVVLRDRGMQSLRGMTRGEHVFELARVEERVLGDANAAVMTDELARPPIPAVLTGAGPFVGRRDELDRLDDRWRRSTTGELGAAFVGGEPGVGKSRLAGELARRVHADGGLVLYGRCDENLAAPLQPFIEAVRVLAPALGSSRLPSIRGAAELTRVVPELAEILGDKPGLRADPDTERLALFDSVAQLLVATSREVPVLLVLDDLHWAGKTTLSLLRHLLREAKESRLLVVGTYRDTELARTHPFAEALADLRRDTDTLRISLGGLGEADIAAYLGAIGNTDHALGHELTEVTAGNPFFLIEVVRHVEESGGTWEPGSLPEGVREATGRRLSRLSQAANDALSVAAVVGACFDLALVEQVRGAELIDPIAEAVHAGLVVEEPGAIARFRFAHAIVRQVLVSELVSLKRVRLHRTIAELLEAAPAAADRDTRLADLAHHWFECASAGSADKAVEACRRAADGAIERLAYDEAGELYGMALQASEWLNPQDEGSVAPLHLARCDALLTAGDVTTARAAIDALELAAAGSERLAAWYTTYEGLLAVLGEPGRLDEIVQSIGAAAGAMHDAGDLVGEAKARYVHASALERLGRIGPAERALDAALAAARRADDRRLADAILAEAPPAALWGPSPVTRASGRCLDVVRVLRITSGTPAVEAVAVRCQAVLEALRGRMDAARRLIGAARRTVEQLGLTHRRLEAELAAGLIELLDLDAVAAEALLRAAYEGLRERGLGGEAAQAGGYLGRALLLQGRVDEADEVATAAEALAGSDLKAAVTWREVRAETAAQRGDVDRALTLAREAAEIADATDALVLVAEARLTLASVLRTAGHHVAAHAEAQRAVEACDAKGATVLTRLARHAMGDPTTESPVRSTTDVRLRAARHVPNLAAAATLRFREAFNRSDWDAVRASHSPMWKYDDRRPVVGMVLFGDDNDESNIFARGGGQLDRPELVATRGDRLALDRWVLRGPNIEVPILGITRVDTHGRGTDFVIFEPEQLDDALAALDEMAASGAIENDATRVARRYETAFNTRNWNAMEACYAEGYTLEERRPLVQLSLGRAQSMETLRFIAEAGAEIRTEVLATRGRRWFLARVTLQVPSPEATSTVLTVSTVDLRGCYERTISFDPDDLDAAFTELDQMFLEAEGAEHAAVLALGGAFLDGWLRCDAAAVDGLLAPGFEARDRRTARTPILDVDALFASFDVGSELNGPITGRIEHITDLSSTGGVWVLTRPGDLPDSGQREIRLVMVLRVTDGCVASAQVFDEHDVDAARAALQAEWVENDATRNIGRVLTALNAHDWDAMLDCYAQGMTLDERRSLVRMSHDHQASLENLRLIFDGHGTLSYDVLATRGRSLCLACCAIWLSEHLAYHEVLTLNRVDHEGRLQETITFDTEDLDLALAELENLASLEVEPTPNAAWRAALGIRDAQNGRDWQALVGLHDPTYVETDNRRGVRLHSEGADALRSHRVAMTLDELAWDCMLVATRGDRLALVRDVISFVDAQGGAAEVEVLPFLECGPDGRIVSSTSFDPDDLEGALAALDARHAELNAPGNTAWRTALCLRDAQNRGDWQAVFDLHDPTYVYDDSRHGVRLHLEGADALDSYRVASSVDAFGEDRTLIAARGDRLALCRLVVSFVDGVVGPSEVEALQLLECGLDGRIVRSAGFSADDMEGALAELDTVHEPGASVGLEWFENDAWRATWRVSAAANHRDLDVVVAAFHPELVVSERRFQRQLTCDEWLGTYRIAVALDQFRLENSLVATRGERLALTRDECTFIDGHAGPAEVQTLTITRVDEQGLVVELEIFEPDDLDSAYEALDERWATHGGNSLGPALKRSVDVRDW